MSNKKDIVYSYECSKCGNKSIIYDYGIHRAVCKSCRTPIENFKKNLVKNNS